MEQSQFAATVRALQNPCIHHHVLFYSINTKLPNPLEGSCNNRDIPSPLFTCKPRIKPHVPLLAFLLSNTKKALSRIQLPIRKRIWKRSHPVFQHIPSPLFTCKPRIKPHVPLLAFLLSNTKKALSRIQLPIRKCIWKRSHPVFQPLPRKELSRLRNFSYIRDPLLEQNLIPLLPNTSNYCYPHSSPNLILLIRHAN